MSSKIIKGTVSTIKNENGDIVTSCETVLKRYLSWGETPKHFSDVRAMELAVACEFALSAINICREKGYIQ